MQDVLLCQFAPSIGVWFRVQTRTGPKIPASGPVRGSNLNRTENPCFRSGSGFRSSPNRNRTIVNPEPRSSSGFGQIPQTGPSVRFKVQPKRAMNRTEPDFDTTTSPNLPIMCQDNIDGLLMKVIDFFIY